MTNGLLAGAGYVSGLSPSPTFFFLRSGLIRCQTEKPVFLFLVNFCLVFLVCMRGRKNGRRSEWSFYKIQQRYDDFVVGLRNTSIPHAWGGGLNS